MAESGTLAKEPASSMRSSAALGRAATASRASRPASAACEGGLATRGAEEPMALSSIAASSAGGRRHSGVNAIRPAPAHMARKRRGWRIVMGPILFDEDGPTLLTKI